MSFKSTHFLNRCGVLSAAFFLLLLLQGHAAMLSEAADVSCSKLILVWEETLSEQEAASYLQCAYPFLTLTEHFSDFSVCSLEDSSLSPSGVLRLLNRDSRIRLAEPDYPMELLSEPNDPYLNTQWAWNNTGHYIHYYGSLAVNQTIEPDVDLNLSEVWDAYPLEKEETQTVLIAVIDTGIDINHEDLRETIWKNPREIPGNGIDDDGNGYIDDVNGWDFYHNDASVIHYQQTESGQTADPDDNDNHGTHCAGVIAAVADNGIGIAGVASRVNVQILPLKIHGGPNASGSVSGAIKAIRYAEAMGAKICNISWGTSNYSQSLEYTIQESSMLFVVAAGNSGSNNNSAPVYPANFLLPNLISVAYVDPYGMLSGNSNYGLSTVTLAAPGQDIYSTIVGGYGYMSGSSMAAPQVSAVAALIYAYREDVYASQVKELMIQTRKPLSSLDSYVMYPGIPDALAVVHSLELLQADHQAPYLSVTTGFEQDTIALSVQAFDAGVSGIRRIKYSYGTRTAEYLLERDAGTLVTGDRLLLTKPGYYTFLAEDYAGNYTLLNYYVADDTTPPVVEASYSVLPDYSGFLFSPVAQDEQSGIKRFAYLIGEFTADAFLNAGNELFTDRTISLQMPAQTTAITFYAEDYRGNFSVSVVYPKIIPAASVHANVLVRTLTVGQSFELQAMLFPRHTTDSISFRSLNEAVLLVDSNGLVTAVGPGNAHVFLTADSGVQRACLITVLEDASAQEQPESQPESPQPTP